VTFWVKWTRRTSSARENLVKTRKLFPDSRSSWGGVTAALPSTSTRDRHNTQAEEAIAHPHTTLLSMCIGRVS